MPCPARLSSDATTLRHTRSGLVVGTKLGTSPKGLKADRRRGPESRDDPRFPACAEGGPDRGGGGVFQRTPIAVAGHSYTFQIFQVLKFFNVFIFLMLPSR